MPRRLWFRIAFVAVVAAGSIWYLYPPKKTINLGLDLQGGIHLVLGVEAATAIANQTERVAETFKAALEQKGIGVTHVARAGNAAIEVQLAAPQTWNDALTVANEFGTYERRVQAQAHGRFRPGLSIRQGSHFHHLPVPQDARRLPNLPRRIPVPCAT